MLITVSNSPCYYAGITFASLEMGRVDEAIAYAKKTLKIDPGFSFILWAWDLGYKDEKYIKNSLLKPLAQVINQS